jgi:ATP sulfurylase
MKVDVFRLNLSHTPVQDIEGLVSLIRGNSDTPICLDTQGAQARTGRFIGDVAALRQGSEVELVASPAEGNESTVPLYPRFFFENLIVDDLIGIDFNNALIQVTQTSTRCLARVISGGIIGSNKAISLLGRTADLSPLTESDHLAIEVGVGLGVEFLALSFANKPEDVELIRSLAGPDVGIIAKIESRSGLEHLAAILAAADSVLIDRGDLSREVSLESLPFIQKGIIERANEAGVPVYVATNLLESMVTEPRPNRVEVNDVINTLIDGADGLVLAAETAIGKYPVQCVDMIQTLIQQFERRTESPSLVWPSASSSRLIVPHGGVLVNRSAKGWSHEDLGSLPRLEIDSDTLMDVRQISNGAFSPLEGFMGLDDLESVLAKCRLTDDTVWPMPVLMQLPIGSSGLFSNGETIALSNGGAIQAVMHVDETFSFDLRRLAAQWFGTEDTSHPGVAGLLEGSERFVSGKVDILPESPARRLPYDLSPSQVREIFEFQGWRRVIGFHTRNVAHRAHEFIQLSALEDYFADGLFIHPVIGSKKPGDFSAEIILKTYQLMIRESYLPNQTVLTGFGTYSRYAGPREAVFTALIRQNFGCSHFIVGRDHTGVGDFYSPDASHRLFDELGDLAVQPIFFNEVYYCDECGGHLEKCRHGVKPGNQISGSQARLRLTKGEMLPDWYMREQLSRLIAEEMRLGHEVFTS